MADAPEWARPLSAPSSAPEWARPLEVSKPKDVAGPPVTLGATDTGLVHFARHAAFGLGDKILAAVQAAQEVKQSKALSLKDFPEMYKRDLALNDATMDASDAAHPVAKWMGNVGGFGTSLAALAAAAPVRAGLAARGLVSAAPEATIAKGIIARGLQGLAEGSKVGTVLGGVGGLGASRADNPLPDIAIGAGIGGLTGGVLGGIGGGVSAKLAQRAASRVTAPGVQQAIKDAAQEGGIKLPALVKSVTPDPEALVLQKYGIPLTLGQMQPGGAASEAEEAALRVPLLGKAVAAQRSAAEDAWRQAVLNEARAPVPGALGPGSPVEQLARIKQDFNTAYGQIAGNPVPVGAVHPETGELVNVRQALGHILQDPEYVAGNEDLSRAGRLFENETGKLDRAAEAAAQNGGRVPAKVLMSMRSAFRDAAESARSQQNKPLAEMFQDAADSIGGGIKAGLSGPDLAHLNATDAAYSRFAKVADAVRRAANNTEEGALTPRQLNTSLAQALGRRFATDPEAGGSLRELARAGKYAFTPRDVPTGHGEMLKSAFGGTVGSLVQAANESPQLQAAFMRAAQRVAGQPRTLASPTAGALEQALGSYLGRPIASSLPGASGAEMATLADLMRRGGQ